MMKDGTRMRLAPIFALLSILSACASSETIAYDPCEMADREITLLNLLQNSSMSAYEACLARKRQEVSFRLER